MFSVLFEVDSFTFFVQQISNSKIVEHHLDIKVKLEQYDPFLALNSLSPFLSDLDQLRKIKRRSPHDDTETFTVYLRSDVEAK